MSEVDYDVIIVGSGIAGAILAKQLGGRGKSVLILEAGPAIPNGRGELMEKFFLDLNKFPEAPYLASPLAARATVEDLIFKTDRPESSYLDQSESAVPFGSTYERRAGGTMWHWMGTSLRFLPKDFRLKTEYGVGVDWPIDYEELAHKVPDGDQRSYYDMAEDEIGVSASVSDQDPGGKGNLFRSGRQYPNPAIPLSRVDQFFQAGVAGMKFEGLDVRVIPTPAGRNSRPYQNRRVCAGNTNCVPICPIEAKYDPTVTLHAALNYKDVSAYFQCVATRVLREGKHVTGIEYVRYENSPERSVSPPSVVTAKHYVLAANAMETPKLLLLSGLGKDNRWIGRNLMDHPFYLRWGLAPKKVYPYRGPLSTGGLDSLRDGQYRTKHAAFRIEIGNDGWALAAQDPARTLNECVDSKNLFGADLVRELNRVYTSQCRIGFELEQLPFEHNRVELSNHRDALGLRKPKIFYSVSDYEDRAFEAAAELADGIFKKLGIEDATNNSGGKMFGSAGGRRYEFMGAGHIIGTCRMGKAGQAVVDKDLRSYDLENMSIVGSSVFPTSGTANPTLTIAALSFRAADRISREV